MEKAERLSIIYFYLLSISRLHTHIHSILNHPDIQCYYYSHVTDEKTEAQKSHPGFLEKSGFKLSLDYQAMKGNYTFHFLLTSIKAPISFYLFLNGVQYPVCQQGIPLLKPTRPSAQWAS